jgi:hypothetical protein
MGPRYYKLGILAFSIGAVLLLATEVLHEDTSVYTTLNTHKSHIFGSIAGQSVDDATSQSLCPTCICSSLGSYLASTWISEPPTLNFLKSHKATERDFAKYLSHHVFLRSQSDPVAMPEQARTSLLNKYITCPDSLFSFSFKRLKLNLPTAYAFTRTSGHGRLGASEKRIRYLSRHADTIKEYYKLVEMEGYQDGVRASDRQLLWLVIEDDDHINPDIARWLLSSGIRELNL